MGALRIVVRRLKPKECRKYLDIRQQYICCCSFFLMPLRHRWKIYFGTLPTRQLIGTVSLQRLVESPAMRKVMKRYIAVQE